MRGYEDVNLIILENDLVALMHPVSNDVSRILLVREGERLVPLQDAVARSADRRGGQKSALAVDLEIHVRLEGALSTAEARHHVDIADGLLGLSEGGDFWSNERDVLITDGSKLSASIEPRNWVSDSYPSTQRH